ncbi:serine hydrolase domain-containing protein [Streptosporangium sp. NPDC051023]|uniref:serine hydrolase domain-containing protein n=1 Tax=Streptosporangium sp. NPDC051023 TaxID=3155410 RepID=UPI00344D58FC
MPVFRHIAVSAAAAVTLVGLLPGGAAALEQPGVLRAELRQALEDTVTAGSVAALAEVRDAGRTYRLAAGKAEYGTPRPAPAGGRFRIASVTKLFTATVILQLSAEGRLRLTDPVGKWLPGVVDRADDITLEHLLRHTSGVPDYLPGLLDASGVVRDPTRTWHDRELVALANRLPRTFDAPGGRFAYSNTNYVLLGMVVEAVTGRPYAREVTERVIRRAGLTGTSAPGETTSIPGPHPHSYALVGGVVTDITALSPTILGAAGGIVSTTADLNRFLRALLGGGLLPPAELALMKTPSPGTTYGMGLTTLQTPCGTFYGQAGGIGGYFTAAFQRQDGRREVSLAATPYTGNPQQALSTLLQRTACA